MREVLWAHPQSHGTDVGAALSYLVGVQKRRATVFLVSDFLTAGFECLPELGRFDALVANIYSDVVIEHAAALREALLPGGWFAFSGCPLQHAAATRAAIERSGLRLEETRVRGRWHTFAGIR